MIPGVGFPTEMRFMRELVTTVANQVIEETGVKVKYKVGTMCELPRACVSSGDLAKDAEFFSFGTNDLTQTTLGFSRDDAAGTFIPVYIEKKILGARSVRSARHRGRRPADAHGCGAGPQDPPRARSGHLRRARRRAPQRGPSATRSSSTTSPARPTACPSPAWPLRRQPWPSAAWPWKLTSNQSGPGAGG